VCVSLAGPIEKKVHLSILGNRPFIERLIEGIRREEHGIQVSSKIRMVAWKMGESMESVFSAVESRQKVEKLTQQLHRPRNIIC
jgi:hypothetical protein